MQRWDTPHLVGRDIAAATDDAESEDAVSGLGLRILVADSVLNDATVFNGG